MGLRHMLGKQLALPSGRAGSVVGAALNRMNRQMIAEAVDAAGVGPGDVAVDIGFGGGAGLALLLDRVGADGAVHGVEVSTAMVAKARRRFVRQLSSGVVELHETPMSRLPFDDASVDAVITLNTIYFIDDLTRAFAEVAGVLTPGGRFVVGIRDPAAMAAMPVTATGFVIRPVADVIAALAARSLRLVEHRRIGGGIRAAHLLVTTPTD